MTSISGFDAFAEDCEDLADSFEQAAESVDDELDTALEATSTAVLTSAQRRAPVDTGELRDSGEHDRRGPLSHWVLFTADHALPVEYGTAPYVIAPDDAEALRFEINGETVYATEVNHPGIQEHAYLRKSLESNRSTLRRNIREAIRRIFQSAFR